MEARGLRDPRCGVLCAGYIYCFGLWKLSSRILQLSISPFAILGQKYCCKGVVIVFHASGLCSTWELGRGHQKGYHCPLSQKPRRGPHTGQECVVSLLQM